jgi:hypothetical protein
MKRITATVSAVSKAASCASDPWPFDSRSRSLRSHAAS